MHRPLILKAQQQKVENRHLLPKQNKQILKHLQESKLKKLSSK